MWEMVQEKYKIKTKEGKQKKGKNRTGKQRKPE